ncbi:MAG: hypothetical protein U9P49_13685 [Thermodesulfobacteriota bacterium]|nr:hypothetical protein [Thermodesulfobacteriota bacterium]
MDKQKQVLALILCGVFVFCSMLMICSPAYCDVEGQQEEEEMLQTHENPMSQDVRNQGATRQGVGKNQKLYINTGDGPGGDKPASSYQQTRPTAPAQSLRPTAPAQRMRPTAPAQRMRPTAPN